MSKSKVIIIACIILDCLLSLYIYLHGKNVQVLNPQGIISGSERTLIFTAGILMLVALIPVYVLYIFVTRKYKDGKNENYTPDSTPHKLIIALWWLFPAVIVFAFAVITWHAAHTLDPYKPIVSKNKPIMIEVVALRWKWLFIYPKQNIATVNYIEIPVNTPVVFQLTADAPMNSFWIPQLSGQIYAMAGMSTTLNIISNAVGDYRGSAAEINGEGFSGMNFMVHVVSNSDFNSWVEETQKTNKKLDAEGYNKLAAPTTNNKQATYSPVDRGLYNTIIMKYLSPSGQKTNMQGMHM